MSASTSIEWTDATWNPIRGCSRVSDGCRNCYAERVAARFSGAGQAYEGLARMTDEGPRWTGEVRLVEEHLEDPLRWTRPRRIFVNSMSDLFHHELSDREVLRVFEVIRASHARALSGGPRHTFQLLTKRANRMLEFCSRLRFDASGHGRLYLGDVGRAYTWTSVLDRLWLGVSVEDRATLHRVDMLRQTPAAVRFLSLEPLLEDLGEVDLRGIHWVIVGGESGAGARPMHPGWVRSLRDQCVVARVPFFFKQWGDWAPPEEFPSEHWVAHHAYVGDEYMIRAGKKQTGRELAGRTWDEFPEIAR